MRPIKFDLPLNGTRIATLEQLEDNLTPEIFEPFRSGKLAKWLRARSLDEQAGAVDVLLAADVQDEAQLFKKLCEIFEREVDEDDAREMIEDYKISLASLNNTAAEKADEAQQAKLSEEDDEEQNIVDNGVIDADFSEVFSSVFSVFASEKPKEKDKKEKYVINEKLLKVVERDKSFGYRFHVMNDISSKKLKNAINSYGRVGTEFETPLVLFDDTIFGSAEIGFLLTDESISIKNNGTYTNSYANKDKKLAISLRDIYKIDVEFRKYGGGRHELTINDESFTFSSGYESSWKAFHDFLTDYLFY
jgi:hypothetical protein